MKKSLIQTSILFALATPALAADVTVSAAASLKDAFGDIARAYEKQYPQDKIKLNTAASGVLLRQIEQGAPVDVFASADQATMDKAAQKQLIQAQTRRNFVRNSLVLVTPKNSSLKLKTLADLQQNSVKKIAIGKPESVPAGKYAQDALQKAKLYDTLKSKYIYTQNVRQASDYVLRGEVDAGFVYRTDAQLKQHSLNIVAEVPTTPAVVYPIAVSQSSKNAAEAKRFTDFILSAQGQQILQRYGFQKP
ncbi:molybdate ABC transporter substrate-binding protein [Neisseriaceae bacterium B1]